MNSSQTKNNNTFSDDEIDLRQLFKVIWNDKKIIIAITKYVNSLKQEYVEVPYDNVAYIAQLR